MTAPHREHDPTSARGVDESTLIRSAVSANMRKARLARALSLRDMSALTGLSTALLSQIEREVANPTVAALTRIAQTLDLSFGELTRPSEAKTEVVRREAHDLDGARARMLFTVMERRRFDISEGVLQPNQAGVPSDHGRGSVEHGYVVAGRCTLVIGDETVHLETGDAVRFSSALPHAYSTGDEPVTLLTVVTYADE